MRRTTHIKHAAFRRLVPPIVISLWGVLLLAFLYQIYHFTWVSDENYELRYRTHDLKEKPMLPERTNLSISLEKRNGLPPRNLDLFPHLAKDHIVIVLYVHNRPQYLKIVVESLSEVEGIGETLLIVSHDGYFEEMNKIVEGIRFCQVKQIFAPYSPHLFPNSFPGVSPGDCEGKYDLSSKKNCKGDRDLYWNYRSPRIVSLKHHWWWMMNTIWDGLNETMQHLGNILFIEEYHFILPNAYRNIQLLTMLKPHKCPRCYAVNLAPTDVSSRGEGLASLFVEKIGNVGYAFNKTVWRKIHSKAREFCSFDDYNWDVTLWAKVYPFFGGPVYTLRGPRASALHFGTCGLHLGQEENVACFNNGSVNIVLEKVDKIVNINSDWEVHLIKHKTLHQAGFMGWGGWGDMRDHQLCLDFAEMYSLRQ
uniref:Alpha-1,6-mannosyl-glycoprotein 2-beta-N-acetylglucosaminyltransferase n=1 Tax=Nelumbo nucifera TaxID=4432 RepID=A0A822XMG9_NELNU|nr:TPA_asm: hypothetical protein HUJ06_021428 [Nelumbo nucifera]